MDGLDRPPGHPNPETARMIRIRSLSLVVARRSILPGLCTALLASTTLPAHAQAADETGGTGQPAAGRETRVPQVEHRATRILEHEQLEPRRRAELQDDTRAGVGGPGLHVTQLVGRGSRGGRTGSQQADGEKDHQAQGSAESKFHWFQ